MTNYFAFAVCAHQCSKVSCNLLLVSSYFVRGWPSLLLKKKKPSASVAVCVLKTAVNSTVCPTGTTVSDNQCMYLPSFLLCGHISNLLRYKQRGME